MTTDNTYNEILGELLEKMWKLTKVGQHHTEKQLLLVRSLEVQFIDTTKPQLLEKLNLFK